MMFLFQDTAPVTTQNLGSIFILVLLGAAFIFFAKGVWEVNAKPDDFQFVHFLGENSNRLALLVFGLVITALILFLDPGNYLELLNYLPLPIKVTSPLIVGAGLSGLCLILPRKAPPAIEP